MTKINKSLCYNHGNRKWLEQFNCSQLLMDLHICSYILFRPFSVNSGGVSAATICHEAIDTYRVDCIALILFLGGLLYCICGNVGNQTCTNQLFYTNNISNDYVDCETVCLWGKMYHYPSFHIIMLPFHLANHTYPSLYILSLPFDLRYYHSVEYGCVLGTE